MPKTKEEILADIAKAVEGQGNQGAIAIAPILKDIVELAGEGGGGGGDATTICGIPVFRVDAILTTDTSSGGVIAANGTLKIADIAEQIYAQVGTDEFLVVSNCESTEDVAAFVNSAISYTPGVAVGRFVPFEEDGQTIVEAYVNFVGGNRSGANKATVITYGIYLNAQNGYEGNSYAWIKSEPTV